MTKLKLLPVMLAAILVASCDTTNVVAFGTHTSYGLDFDTVPQPTFSIGLDRGEAVVAPRYDNGAIPPVVASIKLGGSFGGADVTQVYATGDAARLVTRGDAINKESKLVGNKETMVFGTYTNIGLKVAFAGNVPKSANFGFKRQEISVIPVGKHPTKKVGEESVDTYGSVLAAVDTNAAISARKDTKFGYVAFFATGDAADELAKDEDIRRYFKELANKSVNPNYQIGVENAQRHLPRVGWVIGHITATDGTLDKTALSALFDKAQLKSPGSVEPAVRRDVESSASVQDVANKLRRNYPITTKALFDAMN